MKVVLSETEVLDAVVEWCKMRGIDVEVENIEIKHITTNYGNSPTNTYRAEIEEVEMPVKEGPYR